MAYFPRQGDIVKFDFNPVKGHEQGDYRPVLVISNQVFHEHAGGMVLVLPITSSDKDFPLHVALDSRTCTAGVVLCEHVKSIDVRACNIRYVEQAPNDILEEAIGIVYGSIEL